MALRLNGQSTGYTELNAPANGDSVVLTMPGNDGDAGQYLQTNGSGGLSWQTVTVPDAISVARITDSKASGTSGGTFTSGAWRTRDLNTIEDDPDSIVTLASNQFTLGAGTYLIQWSAPAIKAGSHKTQLWDVTGSTDLAKGTSEYTASADSIQTQSFGFDIVTLAASNTFEIQHRTAITHATNGFGVPSSMAAEKYAMVTIFKLS